MPVSGGVPLLLGLSRQGEIRVQKDYALDFELSPHVHLVVLAENGLQTTHCRVSISLLDVNDNAPRFDYSSYRTAVWEGQAHNTYIMQVDSLVFCCGIVEQRQLLQVFIFFCRCLRQMRTVGSTGKSSTPLCPVILIKLSFWTLFGGFWPPTSCWTVRSRPHTSRLTLFEQLRLAAAPA